MKRILVTGIATFALLGGGFATAGATTAHHEAGSIGSQDTSVLGWAWLPYDENPVADWRCEQKIAQYEQDDPGNYRCVPSKWVNAWIVEKWTHFTG